MKNPVKMVTDLASRLAGARGALDDLHAADKEQRKMHEELQAERSRVLGARPPREEMIAEGERQIDAIADAWAATHGLALIDAIRSGNILDGLPRDIETDIAWRRAEWKRELRPKLEATPYEPGPPTGDRPRVLAELDAKIIDVEAQHSELVDRAAELGIALELLPDVRMRRAHEAHVKSLHDRDARDRARK